MTEAPPTDTGTIKREQVLAEHFDWLSNQAARRSVPSLTGVGSNGVCGGTPQKCGIPAIRTLPLACRTKTDYP